MDYPIPASTEETLVLRNNSVNEEIIALAIADVVNIARQQGQSLEDVTADVLQDHSLLELNVRQWLSELVAQAWKIIPRQQEEA